MAIMKAFVHIAVIAALVAVASAAPSAKPKPFHLPATYFTGGGLSGMWIDFNEDGTFRTKRNVPASVVCGNEPVCPELGGQGSWSFAPDTGMIMLEQIVGPGWTVAQEWRMGSVSRDLYSSFINGNRLIWRTGRRSDEFPLPWYAVDWERKLPAILGAANASNAELAVRNERPKPFPLPATYITGGSVSITIIEDGTFRTRRDAPPSLCAGRSTCPEHGGLGTWTWNQETLELALKEEISADWTTEQVWKLDGMSRDASTSEITRARLVSSAGREATRFPIPYGRSHWTRSR